MGTTPLFGSVGLAVPFIELTTVSADRTGAGTYADLGSVASSGGMYAYGFQFNALGASESNVATIFYHDGSSCLGIFREVSIPAIAPGNGHQGPPGWKHYEPIFDNGRPLLLKSGHKFQIALLRAGSINVLVDAQQLA